MARNGRIARAVVGGIWILGGNGGSKGKGKSRGKGKGKGKGRSGFPPGMTDRKARARAGATARATAGATARAGGHL